MRNTLKYLLLASFLIIPNGLIGQEKKTSLLSYSLSYIQPTIISSQGEFEYVPIYLNVEANVHYKPFDFISFTSGIGYNKNGESIYFSHSSSTLEQSNYQELFVSGIRLPLQVNFHFTNEPMKTDSYLKAVYTNGFTFHKNIQYENDIATGTRHTSFYDPSIGIGIGSIFLKNKPLGIILEGLIEKYLRYDSFKEATWYSIKIGVII
jgi:hypothetical protein